MPSDADLSAPRGRLLAWYDDHQRDLPWRRTTDPYAILVSEVMLQQTQVARIMERWPRFLARFPDLPSLATAEEDDVLHEWQGAGYYSRARRLHALARTVVAEHEGRLPADHAALLALPGIGPYTAAAVASIAFDLAHAVVDGNVRRVLARLSGDPDPTPSATQALADAWLDRARPGDWNQAIMELGATICRPRSPSCDTCPLAADCTLRLHALDPATIPAPKRQTPTRVRAWALALHDPSGQRWHLTRHPDGGLFAGLWGLPRLDDGRLGTLRERLGVTRTRRVGSLTHLLSHRRLEVTLHLAAAQPQHELAEPDDLAISELDRRLLALARAHLQPQDDESDAQSSTTFTGA